MQIAGLEESTRPSTRHTVPHAAGQVKHDGFQFDGHVGRVAI